METESGGLGITLSCQALNTVAHGVDSINVSWYYHDLFHELLVALFFLEHFKAILYMLFHLKML